MIVRDVRTGVVMVGGVQVSDTPQAILAATRAQMSCTPRQARLAMIQTAHEGFSSLLAAVENAIYASENPAIAVTWEYATIWHRNDPFIAILGPALGLTDTQIDALFVRAMAT